MKAKNGFLKLSNHKGLAKSPRLGCQVPIAFPEDLAINESDQRARCPGVLARGLPETRAKPAKSCPANMARYKIVGQHDKSHKNYSCSRNRSPSSWQYYWAIGVFSVQLANRNSLGGSCMSNLHLLGCDRQPCWSAWKQPPFPLAANYFNRELL